MHGRELMECLRGVLISATAVAFAGMLYVGWMALRAWWEAKQAPKVDMFTCDKHGPIFAKDVMQIPMDDGGPPYKQCPFCFEDTYKIADARLRAEEAKRVAPPVRPVQ